MATHQSWRIVLGWLIVAMGALCQSPRLYGDPSCPNCANKSGGHVIGPDLGVPTLGGPPAGVPTGMVAGPALDHSHNPLMPQGDIVPTDLPSVAILPVEIPVPIVKLRIKAPACAVVGKELEYRVKVENCTPTDAHNVTVRMSMPPSVRVLRASPQVHQRDPELQWNLGTVPGFGCHDIVVLVMPVGLADVKSCTRVTYEHGQCVTTKVMALAPEGSEDGRVPPGTIPGTGRPDGSKEPGVGWPGRPGDPDARGDFDVRVFGPPEASIGQATTYKVTVFNKSDRPIYKVGVLLEWGKDLEFVNSSEKITGPPGLMAWPEGLIEVLPANSSRSLDLILRTRVDGRFCVKASASASLSQNPADNKIANSRDELCTQFRRGIPGMTLEMYDRDDPILKNAQTSYPITVRNQGRDPITNLRVKARVPELLQMTEVRGPVRYKAGADARKEFWIEFEPLSTLNVGETQTYEILVNGKGQTGDARFHIEMTADQLDKGPNDSVRWIIEQESTTLVPDEETRVRIREISRKMRERIIPGRITSDSK